MVNVFAGIESFMGQDPPIVQRGISVNNNPVAGDGKLLATIATAEDPTVGGLVIGEWQAGAVMGNGSADVLGGPRLVFLTGSREADGFTGGNAAGFYDLEPDGGTDVPERGCLYARESVGGGTVDLEHSIVGRQLRDRMGRIRHSGQRVSPRVDRYAG